MHDQKTPLKYFGYVANVTQLSYQKNVMDPEKRQIQPVVSKIYGTEQKLDISYKIIQQNGETDRAILLSNIWTLASFYQGYS